MRVPSIEEVTEKLFSLPENVAIPRDELATLAGEFLGLMNRLPLGQLESITRRGNDFIAQSSAPALVRHNFIVIHSAATVTFTARNGRQELQMTKIKGLDVELPIPLIPRIVLDWVNVSLDERQQLVLYTRKGFIPITVRIDSQTGAISFF
ncbi:MAG TPA: hypothetical protein V6D22_06200 [Candidatus Obscuribacterales bacterium]